jgi:hypothetical protein
MALCAYGLRDDLTVWALAAIACTAALHLWTAVARERIELEYTGLALAAAAFLLVFREFHMDAEKYCLAAAAIPVAFYALSFLARRLGSRAFIASSFDLAAPAAATALVFAAAWSMEKPHLWFAIATTAVLSAVYLALAFVETPRKWLVPAAAAFVGSALLAASYLLLLQKYSTGTPYRSLWIFGIAPVLAAFGLWLRRAEKMKPQGSSAIAVSVIVSLLALWQALAFPDKPLVATLAFAAAAALYAVLAAMLSSAVFGTFASAAFSVAYFSLLRHLQVPDHNYVLWLVALAMLQALVGGAGEDRARERRPAMFVGLAVTVAVISWMIARGELYFDRQGPGLDSAIFATVGSAMVFALVAWLRRTPVALYPAAAALLGSYYLVLHKYDVTATEFYTVPVAALGLLWERLVLRRRWGPGLWPTLAAAAALALALGPSLVLSLDSKELGHALAALCLGTVAVGAGMAMRRKVYLVLGTLTFAGEGVIKLYHFVHRFNLGHWIWLVLVGVAIMGFVVYAETRRNKRLREATDETVKKVARMFDDWE